MEFLKRWFSKKKESSSPASGPPIVTLSGDLAKKCGGCGVEGDDLELVRDKKQNRGYLCVVCKDRYGKLLQPESNRNFWMCGGCKFRVLAGTDIDSRVDELLNKCPKCGVDLTTMLVNLKNDNPIGSGVIGEPLE